MATILSHIVRKRYSRASEDIATDALAYLLDSSESVRDALNAVLQHAVPGLPPVWFKTQRAEGAIRPDMWGLVHDEPRVFVENKFWAGLTDRQPVQYLARLALSEAPTVLLVIAPAAREGTLWRELGRRLAVEDISIAERAATPGVARLGITGAGPMLALTSWTRLLAALDAAAADDPATRGDLAQLRALCQASDEDAFLPLTAEELTDQRTPALMLQLGNLVQRVTDLGLERGVFDVDGLRPQASWDRIGRYIWLPARRGAGAWFGVHLGYWKEHGGTPMWLVFADSEFGRANEIRPLLERWATLAASLVVVSPSELAVPLDLLTGEEADAVAYELLNDIGAIVAALEGLPARS